MQLFLAVFARQLKVLGASALACLKSNAPSNFFRYKFGPQVLSDFSQYLKSDLNLIPKP